MAPSCVLFSRSCERARWIPTVDLGWLGWICSSRKSAVRRPGGCVTRLRSGHLASKVSFFSFFFIPSSSVPTRTSRLGGYRRRIASRYEVPSVRLSSKPVPRNIDLSRKMNKSPWTREIQRTGPRQRDHLSERGW